MFKILQRVEPSDKSNATLRGMFCPTTSACEPLIALFILLFVLSQFNE